MHIFNKIIFCFRGRMNPRELERLIIERKSKGQIPFFVNCTSGTTVLGAFDPINDIADICEKYKLWLHIDVSTFIQIYRVHYFKNIRNPNQFREINSALCPSILSEIHLIVPKLINKKNEGILRIPLFIDCITDGSTVISAFEVVISQITFRIHIQFRSLNNNRIHFSYILIFLLLFICFIIFQKY